MFTCVSNRGLNSCPKKASVSKSLSLGFWQTKYVLSTDNTLAVPKHIKKVLLKGIVYVSAHVCMCVCTCISIKYV